jgi:hypothetical protein
MVILNAPWKLDEALRESLPAMARLLSKDRPVEWKLDWLLEEGAEPPAPSPLPPSRLAALGLPTARVRPGSGKPGLAGRSPSPGKPGPDKPGSPKAGRAGASPSKAPRTPRIRPDRAR